MRELFTEVGKCDVCANSHYQSIPFSHVSFNDDARILIVGQNPGRFDIYDDNKLWWMARAEEAVGAGDATIIEQVYRWDFILSTAYSRLSAIFGDGWLYDGRVIWTNAVRCRTENNRRPSDEMVGNCYQWTKRLLKGRDAVVVVGAVARNQIFGYGAPLEWGQLRRHRKFGLVLAIRHYAAWGRGGPFGSYNEELMAYRRAFARMLREVYGE